MAVCCQVHCCHIQMQILLLRVKHTKVNTRWLTKPFLSTRSAWCDWWLNPNVANKRERKHTRKWYLIEPAPSKNTTLRNKYNAYLAVTETLRQQLVSKHVSTEVIRTAMVAPSCLRGQQVEETVGSAEDTQTIQQFRHTFQDCGWWCQLLELKKKQLYFL